MPAGGRLRQLEGEGEAFELETSGWMTRCVTGTLCLRSMRAGRLSLSQRDIPIGSVQTITPSTVRWRRASSTARIGLASPTSPSTDDAGAA